MSYQYKIGTSQATLVLLSELGIPAPKHGFVAYSRYIELDDGTTQGNGWPEDEWYWGFLSGSQRATLKTLVPGAGAHIFVRDLKDDGITYKDFEADATWPQNEDRQNGRRLGFSLKLKAMIELEDLP